jgi:hypothetical protein
MSGNGFSTAFSEVTEDGRTGVPLGPAAAAVAGAIELPAGLLWQLENIVASSGKQIRTVIRRNLWDSCNPGEVYSFYADLEGLYRFRRRKDSIPRETSVGSD